jgi:hypothetical protein
MHWSFGGDSTKMRAKEGERGDQKRIEDNAWPCIKLLVRSPKGECKVRERGVEQVAVRAERPSTCSLSSCTRGRDREAKEKQKERSEKR